MSIVIRLAVTLFAVWCPSGCATIAAHRAEQAKWQGLADQATAALGTASVYVVPVSGIRGRYHCASRRLELGTDQQERSARWLLAHELGHHLDGRCGDVLAQEIAANVAAVRVMQTWGMTEYQAAKQVAAYLWASAKDGRMRGMPGHDAYAELVAVLRAYPAVTNPTDGTCAAELAAAKTGG